VWDSEPSARRLIEANCEQSNWVNVGFASDPNHSRFGLNLSRLAARNENGPPREAGTSTRSLHQDGQTDALESPNGGAQMTRIPAPAWTDRVPDRIAWCVWFLSQNPLVYSKFRELANQYQARNPGRGFSSELIVNVLRFHSSTRAEGDQYALNSNAKSLLARLFLLEQPKAPIEKRNSWLDHLAPNEMQLILDAWQANHGPQS
jgi:hypothetical protein